MFKIIAIFLGATLLNIQTCDKEQKDFIVSKIKELESKPVYNPPASIEEWDYKGVIYYYVTADCCDRFNELYNVQGELVCHPDGGFTGQGDGKCPFDLNSSDTLNLKRKLIWKDDRKSS